MRLRRFLADASGELRTQLTAIRELVERYRLEPGVDVGMLMDRIERESVRGGHVLDDLLAHVKMEAQFPAESEPIDVHALVVEVVRDARLRGGRFSVRMSAENGDIAQILGDRIRIRLAVSTLITAVSTHALPDTSVMVRLEFADARVRIMVSTIDSVPPVDSVSLCAGMAVVRSIATAHGGLVRIGDDPRDGVAVAMELPVVRRDERFGSG